MNNSNHINIIVLSLSGVKLIGSETREEEYRRIR